MRIMDLGTEWMNGDLSLGGKRGPWAIKDKVGSMSNSTTQPSIHCQGLAKEGFPCSCGHLNLPTEAVSMKCIP